MQQKSFAMISISHANKNALFLAHVSRLM